MPSIAPIAAPLSGVSTGPSHPPSATGDHPLIRHGAGERSSSQPRLPTSDPDAPEGDGKHAPDWPGISLGAVTLEITHRCHRRCVFCYVTGRSRSGSSTADELSAAELAGLVGTVVRGTGCKSVQLSGGEPLVRHDLLPLIDGLQQPTG